MITRTSIRQIKCFTPQRFSSSRAKTTAEKAPEMSPETLITKYRSELSQQIKLLGKLQENFVASQQSLESCINDKMPEVHDTLQSWEVEWDDRLTNLRRQYAEKEFEFEVEFKKKKDTLVLKHLEELNYKAISKSEYESLTNEVADLKMEQQTKFEKYQQEVHKAYETAKNNLQEKAELTSKAELAEWKAKVEQKEQQVVALKEIITSLKEELLSTRENVRHVAEAAKSSPISQSFGK